MRSPVVTALQRQLLVYLRAARASQARGLLHLAISCAPPESTVEHHHARVLPLRQRIQALDPDACLYETWGGPMPTITRDRRD